MRRCMVPTCGRDTVSPYSGKSGFICLPCWFRLSLETRRRYWRETSYGGKPPGAELSKVISEELSGSSRGDRTDL